MRRSFSRWWLGLSILAILAPGCGKDPFVPGRRAKAVPTVTESDRSKPVYVVYLLPGQPTDDLLVWGLRAQQVANDRHAIFRMMGPGPDESSSEQPKAIAKALADGASTLIVYPGGSPELPKALAEAEAKGVPVVLLAKSLAAPEGLQPFTIVEPAPFDESAGQIVAATIDDLKRAKQPVDGTALVTVDKVTDDGSARRVAALKSAAVAAKFRQVVTVPFDSANPDSAKLAVLEAVKTYPDVSVVLADDAEGLLGAAAARIDSKAKPIFFVGGYTDVRSSTALQQPKIESCFVEGRYVELGGQAVLVALAKLRGEPTGPLASLTPKFTKGEGSIWTEGQVFAPTLKRLSEDKDAMSKEVPAKSGGNKPQ